jgi:hypothetical protein
MDMRLPAFIAMGAVLFATAACAPTNDAVDGRAPATSEAARDDRPLADSMPADSLPADSMPADSVPAGAAGKISADQVGKISPVPAFQGAGADWSVEIASLGEMRHSVKLISGDDVQTGTAVSQPTTDAPAQILLTGTLYANGGDHPLRITLTRGECRDAAGRLHGHGVRIDIAGATPLQGCGDLAMY